jgi:hypothetical protein
MILQPVKLFLNKTGGITMRKLLSSIFLLFIITFLCLMPAYVASSTDEAVLGNNRWSVTSSGDLIPNTTNAYDIGSSTYYPASICLGGECKTSWGSVVSPVTDATGYIYPTDAGSYLRLYDAGYIRLGDATNAGSYYVLFTDDSDAFYAGKYATSDDFMIGYGSTIGTTPRLSIVDSATVTNVVIGDATQYDMQITFDGNAQDYSIGIDDTADDLIICLGSALGTTTAIGIDENLAIATYGDITMGGTTPTLVIGDAGAEDSKLYFDGNAQDFYVGLEDATDDFEIGLGSTLGTTPAISITDGLAITTYADITMTGTTPTLTVGDAGNEDNSIVFSGVPDFTIGVDATASLFEITNGLDLDQTTAFSIADSTLLATFAGDVTITGTTPTLTVGDSGTEDASIIFDGATTTDYYIAYDHTGGQASTALEIGVGSAVGTTPVLAIDASSNLILADKEYITDATDVIGIWGDDAAATVKLVGYEASAASLQLLADQDDDATDGWQLTNAGAGSLAVGCDSSAAGTFLTKLTISSAGVLTLSDSETLTDASDVVTLQADDAAASFVVSGFEAGASAITIQSDEGDDAADKFVMSMANDAGSNLMTITTGAVTAATVSNAGLWTLAAETVTGATLLNGAVTVGDNIADITTFTGKIAGATPLSFDGTTANTVYTIFAMDDPASASKTITFPAVTGTVMLSSAATALTPGAAVALTVTKGNQLFTDTPTDNEDQTITFSGAGAAGDLVTIIFTTISTGDEVITFHATLVSSTGTLTCGTTAARYYVIQFVSNGTHWYEVSRTAVQT